MKNLQLNEINNLVEVSKILAQTPFYSKLGAGGVLAIYLTAMELNLPVMFCLNGGLYNIDGKVSLSGQAINMMLVNAGWQINFKIMDEKTCHLQFLNPKNKSINEFIYTIDDAKKAGYLSKKNWVNHPKDMLFNRCIASGGRKYAPDVVGNCYGVGEIEIEEKIITSANFDYQPLQIEEEKEEIEKIVYKGLDDVEQFKERHNIKQGEKIFDFVLKIAQKKKIDHEKALVECFLNEEKFIECFKKFDQQTQQIQ